MIILPFSMIKKIKNEHIVINYYILSTNLN